MLDTRNFVSRKEGVYVVFGMNAGAAESYKREPFVKFSREAFEVLSIPWPNRFECRLQRRQRDHGALRDIRVRDVVGRRVWQQRIGNGYCVS